jgi:hypothetical protein
VTNLLKTEDAFNPRSNFVACRTSWFIEVYNAVSHVLVGWSFFWFMSIAGVCLILSLHDEFARDFPWSSASRHALMFHSYNVENGFEV